MLNVLLKSYKKVTKSLPFLITLVYTKLDKSLIIKEAFKVIKNLLKTIVSFT